MHILFNNNAIYPYYVAFDFTCNPCNKLCRSASSLIRNCKCQPHDFKLLTKQCGLNGGNSMDQWVNRDVNSLKEINKEIKEIVVIGQKFTVLCCFVSKMIRHFFMKLHFLIFCVVYFAYNLFRQQLFWKACLYISWLCTCV